MGHYLAINNYIHKENLWNTKVPTLYRGHIYDISTYAYVCATKRKCVKY